MTTRNLETGSEQWPHVVGHFQYEEMQMSGSKKCIQLITIAHVTDFTAHFVIFVIGMRDEPGLVLIGTANRVPLIDLVVDDGHSFAYLPG